MYTIYSSIQELCEKSGIKPGKMCNDIGISRSILTDLKTGRKKSINTDTAQKIADYFGVSVDRVLGTEQKEEPSAQMSEEQEKIMNETKDMSQAELMLLMERIDQIKKSRI